ncbi:hypothetical protein [Aquimarina sp. RZ0]|uniref:hypothetical protein n=1 Tax=Aquimarina sp. RZ0 TaxID=2607730 RepID=UPI0011F12303|nr:hypothetical protein [Aquimarina sp. RZ0]KAA1244317.1 hypothetical protein F0000_16940 [Aquimarina sp. RZ0]
MSQGNSNNEEIDLGQIFNVIKNFFRSVLKSIASIVLFYKKKWILFTTICIIGGILGYFLDKKLNLDKEFVQEIILEPKKDTGEYIYGFLENMESRLGSESFLKKLKLDSTQVLNLKQITLEPILQYSDVLDYFKNVYGEKDAHHIIDELDPELLESKKYRKFYKYHKLTIYFKNAIPDNNNIVKAFLDYISSNAYYDKILTFEINQVKLDLQKNKETLVFVDEYLDKLSKNPIHQEKEIVVYAEASEIPTISSLLEKKNELMHIINRQEKFLILDKNLFEIVEYGNIISQKAVIYKRMIILLPILICIFISMFFFLKNSIKRMDDFIRE